MKLISAYYQGEDPFKIFKEVRSIVNPMSMTGKDEALILWGGEDISPSLYNQQVVHARASSQPSARDVIESNLFKRAVELGMPIIGICRGAQLGCALSGGSLFQHIHEGHHGKHDVETKDGHVFETSSCHHQALNLRDVDHELLAWDKGRKITVYTDKEMDCVVIPEVAVLNQTKVFAIQGHPEWMHHDSPFVKWCANQIKERFF